MIALSFVEQLNQANSFRRSYDFDTPTLHHPKQQHILLEQEPRGNAPLEASNFALQFLESLNMRNRFSADDTLFTTKDSPPEDSEYPVTANRVIQEADMSVSSAALVARCSALSNQVFLANSGRFEIQALDVVGSSSAADLLIENSRLVASAVHLSSCILGRLCSIEFFKSFCLIKIKYAQGMQRNATFDYDPDEQLSVPNSIPISKGNEIVANLDSLHFSRVNGWAFVEGTNLTKGRAGAIPVLGLEPYAIAIDMGTCRIISGVFDGKNLEFSSIQKFNNRIGFENYTNRLSALAGDKGLKGLKRWCDVLDRQKQKPPSPSTKLSDPHFQLVNVEWETSWSQSKYHQASILGHDVVELLAFQLRGVKEEADRHLNQNSCRIIMPLPLSFHYTSRLLLKKAAIEAGFTSVDFIPQNVALAQYFFSHNESRQQKPVTLFVSMGQSYTDIGFCRSSFSNQNQRRLEFISVAALEIGGANWTNAIFEQLKNYVSSNINISNEAERQLYSDCELAKIDLATSQSTKILFLNDFFTLTRTKYEEITKHLVEELVQSIKNCLTDHLRNEIAENGSDFLQIALFGGPFRQKHLIDSIAETFPGSSMHVISDPAAISNGAAHLFSVNSRLRLPIVSSTRNYHYGIQVGDQFHPILLPHQTVNLAKFRVSKGSRAASFLVYEGNYQRNEFNSLIATIIVDDIPFIEFAELKVEISVNPGGEICLCLFPPLQKFVLNQPSSIHVHVTSFPDWNLNALQQGESTLAFAPKRLSYHFIDRYFNKLCEIQAIQTPLRSECVSKALFVKLKSHLILFEQYLASAPLQRHQWSKYVVDDNNGGVSWYSRLSQVIYQSLVIIADCSFESFPEHWSEILMKEIEIEWKVLSLWKSHPSPVIMEIGASASMEDHQRSSFNQLYELNENILLYTSEHHFRVADLEVVVSSSNQILPQDNKEMAFYIDELERFLLKLDACQVHDHQLLKLYRKSIIRYCQTCLAQFDWLKRLYLCR